MSIISQFEIKRELDRMAPAMAIVLTAMAVDEALTDLDFKPLTNLVESILGSPFE
jgi:hypothetical protein